MGAKIGKKVVKHGGVAYLFPADFADNGLNCAEGLLGFLGNVDVLFPPAKARLRSKRVNFKMKSRKGVDDG